MVISRVIQERWLPALALAVSAAILLWVVYNITVRMVAGHSSVPAALQVTNKRQAAVTDYKVQDIVNAHLFGKVQQQVVEKTEAPRTRLQLKLVGMVASQDPKRAVAVISANNGPSKPYRIGEAIKPSGAVLKAVEPEKVIIERSGRMESLYIERPTINKAGPGQSTNSKNVETQPAITQQLLFRTRTNDTKGEELKPNTRKSRNDPN